MPFQVLSNQYRPRELAFLFIFWSLAPRTTVNFEPGFSPYGNLEVPAAEPATSIMQATMEACKVWKQSLGMSQAAELFTFSVRFCAFLLLSLVCLVLTQLISCNGPDECLLFLHSTWLSGDWRLKPPQGWRQMKKGDFLQRWDHPGFAYLRFSLCFSFLLPLSGVATFSLDQTSGTPHAFAP